MTPETNIRTMGYYEPLQNQCDEGQDTWLLNTLQVAINYINDIENVFYPIFNGNMFDCIANYEIP